MPEVVFYDGEILVTPPLTASDASVMLAVVGLKKTAETQSIFDAIAADPDADIPYYGDLFEVSEDGSYILPEEDESRHGIRTWLRSLLVHFFTPRGYSLNGEITWQGRDVDDRGCVYVKDNQMDAVDDLIVNPGPVWAPLSYADDKLKEVIKHLVESADNTGCSPDLTVVSAEHLQSLTDIHEKSLSVDAESLHDPEVK